MNDALNGKPTANLVNIINPATHPAIIDQAYLRVASGFAAGLDARGRTRLSGSNHGKVEEDHG